MIIFSCFDHKVFFILNNFFYTHPIYQTNFTSIKLQFSHLSIKYSIMGKYFSFIHTYLIYITYKELTAFIKNFFG